MHRLFRAYAWIKRRLGLTGPSGVVDVADQVADQVAGKKTAVDSKGKFTGNRGEREAAKYLTGLGYKILAVNLRGQIGEIDLLMETPDSKTVVVVEVKTRDVDPARPSTMSRQTKPEVRVGYHKQKKLVLLGQWAVKRMKLTNRRVRFDVIGVDLYVDGKVDIRHHPAAFESHV